MGILKRGEPAFDILASIFPLTNSDPAGAVAVEFVIDVGGLGYTVSLIDNAGGIFSTGVLSQNRIILTGPTPIAVHKLRVLITDSIGRTRYKQVTVSVVAAAQPFIEWVAPLITENSAPGTPVGSTLSVTNGTGTYTFTYVDNAGNRFAMSGAQPVAGSVATDFETATVHSVMFQADNGVDAPLFRTFFIPVTNVNEAPTDIVFSAAAIGHLSPVGTVAGTLTAVDPDSGDFHVWSFDSNPGSLFSITGNQVKVAATLTAGVKNVTVRATDTGALSFSKVIPITVATSSAIDETAFDFTAGTMPAGASIVRPVAAYRWKSDRTLESIGVNLPRFDYDFTTGAFLGLRAGRSYAQGSTQPQAFNSWGLNGISAFGSGSTANDPAQTDLLGGTTADYVQESTANSTHSLSLTMPIGMSGTAAVQRHRWIIKPNTRNTLRLSITVAGVYGFWAFFDLSGVGTITSTGKFANGGTFQGATVTKLPSGFFICDIWGKCGRNEAWVAQVHFIDAGSLTYIGTSKGLWIQSHNAYPNDLPPQFHPNTTVVSDELRLALSAGLYDFKVESSAGDFHYEREVTVSGGFWSFVWPSEADSDGQRNVGKQAEILVRRIWARKAFNPVVNPDQPGFEGEINPTWHAFTEVLDGTVATGGGAATPTVLATLDETALRNAILDPTKPVVMLDQSLQGAVDLTADLDISGARCDNKTIIGAPEVVFRRRRVRIHPFTAGGVAKGPTNLRLENLNASIGSVGALSGDNEDSFQVNAGDTIYIKHMTCTRSVDELIQSLWHWTFFPTPPPRRIIIEYSIIAHPLTAAGIHPEGIHYYGPYFGGACVHVIIRKSIVAAILERGPQTVFAKNFGFFNNIVYGWTASAHTLSASGTAPQGWTPMQPPNAHPLVPDGFWETSNFIGNIYVPFPGGNTRPFRSKGLDYRVGVGHQCISAHYEDNWLADGASDAYDFANAVALKPLGTNQNAHTLPPDITVGLTGTRNCISRARTFVIQAGDEPDSLALAADRSAKWDDILNNAGSRKRNIDGTYASGDVNASSHSLSVITPIRAGTLALMPANVLDGFDPGAVAPPQVPVSDGTLPTIDDTTPFVGQVLGGTNGGYTPAATSYQIQWRRDGATNIVGATADQYTAVLADQGHTLQRGVKGVNASGPSIAFTWSAQTSLVTAAPVVGNKQYFGSNGVSRPLYNGLVSPQAYYDSATNKTWCSFDGATPAGVINPRNAWVRVYDHNTLTWSTAVSAGAGLTNDDHGSPSLVKHSSGHWFIFYGSHFNQAGGAQPWSRTTTPNDPSAWTVLTPIPPAAGAIFGYTKAVIIGNSLYLFSRSGTSSYNMQLSKATISTDGLTVTWLFKNRILVTNPTVPVGAQYVPWEGQNTRHYVRVAFVSGTKIYLMSHLNDFNNAGLHFHPSVMVYETATDRLQNAQNTFGSTTFPISAANFVANFTLYVGRGQEYNLIFDNNLDLHFWYIDEVTGNDHERVLDHVSNTWSAQSAPLSYRAPYGILYQLPDGRLEKIDGVNNDTSMERQTRSLAGVWGSITTIFTPQRSYALSGWANVRNSGPQSRGMWSEWSGPDPNSSETSLQINPPDLRIYLWGDSGLVMAP